MTGNAPVADSMPVTDNRPVCCGSFLPDKCCVQLKEAVDFTHMRKKRLISTLYGLSGFGFTKTRRWDPSSRSFYRFQRTSFSTENKNRIKLLIHNKQGIIESFLPLHSLCIYLLVCLFVFLFYIVLSGSSAKALNNCETVRTCVLGHTEKTACNSFCLLLWLLISM